MVEPYLLHFVVRNITFHLTADGYIITCYTNLPCHLFMRYTTTRPEKHIHSREVRGAPVGTYIDQCFVVYEDNEQEEAGDTYTHTFIKEPWAHCETRWFYFWGTVAGEVSPSASAIFQKHRKYAPVEYFFYSDHDPEVSSVDGEAGRFGAQTWAQLRNGAGTSAFDAANSLGALIAAGTHVGEWVHCIRPILLFDTSIIPANYDAVEADLRLYCFFKHLTLLPTSAITVYKSAPASNTALVPSDYQTLDDKPLAQIIAYNDVVEDGWNQFNLNSDGLLAIITGGITKLGLREALYDGPDTEPPWSYHASTSFEFYSADHIPNRHPVLHVLASPSSQEL